LKNQIGQYQHGYGTLPTIPSELVNSIIQNVSVNSKTNPTL